MGCNMLEMPSAGLDKLEEGNADPVPVHHCIFIPPYLTIFYRNLTALGGKASLSYHLAVRQSGPSIMIKTHADLHSVLSRTSHQHLRTFHTSTSLKQILHLGPGWFL